MGSKTASKYESTQLVIQSLIDAGFHFYSATSCCGRIIKYKRDSWVIKLVQSAQSARLYHNSKTYSSYVPFKKIEELIAQAV